MADITDATVNCDCDDGNFGAETLLALRTKMMVRLGYGAMASTPPPGMASLLDSFLDSAQKYCYSRFPQTNTERFFFWNMTNGVRFYDLRENNNTCAKKFNRQHLHWVGIKDQNDRWYPLIEGIPPEWYTTMQNQGYPCRYEIRQCIEVFPAPQNDDMQLIVKAHFELQAFTLTTDVTTIDPQLVFTRALAMAKAHYGQPDARAVGLEADALLGSIVAGAHGTRRYIPTGGTPPPPWPMPIALPLPP